MSPTQLSAIRRFLFFSGEEAARYIAASPDRPDGVQPRAWRYWETGERGIPDDVVATIRALLAWRGKALDAAREAMQRTPQDAEVALVWYGSAEDWLSLHGREAVYWRPQCSVVAAIAAERENVVLVPFDRKAFRRCLLLGEIVLPCKIDGGSQGLGIG